jgi:signal transduction histidine kinase
LQAAERGIGLVHRLLAFAREQRLESKAVDIAIFLPGMKDLPCHTSGSSIQFSIATEPDLAPAGVDANQLELAILNLTINARDAIPGGGALRVTLGNRRTDDGGPGVLPSGRYVVVSIRTPEREWMRQPLREHSTHFHDERSRQRFRARLADGPTL